MRTVTGSGTSLQFNWDGTGEGGTNLPAGVYYHVISAETNGQSFESESSGGGSTASETLGSPSAASAAMELLATRADGSGAVLPLRIYPPGFNTNNLIIFEGSMADVLQAASFAANESLVTMEDGGSTPEDFNGPAAQAAPPAPDRPPTTPRDGTVGKFAFAYQTYKANGTNGFTPALPLSTPGLQLRVQIEGHGTGDPPNFPPLPDADSQAIFFGVAMAEAAWSPGYSRGENDLTIGDLRGSGTPFNQVDIGFLVLHGVYGTSQDYYAGGCKQMYFPIAAGTTAQYLRMSEMSFGGDGTNGLKWMAIKAGSSLYHVNWSSMQSQNIHPYTSGLHLLLGVDTKDHVQRDLGQVWAKFMIGNPKLSQAPRNIREAWYQGATYAYTNSGRRFTVSPMVFAVAGDEACRDDMLQTKTNTVLTGSWFYNTRQVYPPQ